MALITYLGLGLPGFGLGLQGMSVIPWFADNGRQPEVRPLVLAAAALLIRQHGRRPMKI
jgi:hypothetical protein